MVTTQLFDYSVFFHLLAPRRLPQCLHQRLVAHVAVGDAAANTWPFWLMTVVGRIAITCGVT